MIRAAAALFSLVAVIFFPWPYAAAVALLAGGAEPLVPFAVGLFADILYYPPSSGHMPLFTLAGLAATLALFFVRKWFRASII